MPSKEGQTLRKAFEIVKDACGQASALFSSLDEALLERGLQSLHSARLSGDIAPRLTRSPESWLPGVLSRGYTPRDEDEFETPQSKVLAFEIHFSPSKSSEPLILASFLEFKTPQATKRDMWNAWYTPILGAFQDPLLDGKWHEPTLKNLVKAIPEAMKAIAFMLPLCDLDDTNLRERLVVPAMELWTKGA